MPSRTVEIVGLLLCAGVVAGCGGVSSETVAGKVTIDGSPLPNAYLMLVPTDKAVKGGPFLAKTDDQGQFEMGPVGKPGDGVPAGAYKLTITTAYNESGDEFAVTPRERVPAPYPTGVDFEVPDGGQSDVNFELKSK